MHGASATDGRRCTRSELRRIDAFRLDDVGAEEFASMSPQELMEFIRGLRLIATDVVWLVSGHRTDSAPSPGG
jgi:hypothetical protein